MEGGGVLGMEVLLKVAIWLLSFYLRRKTFQKPCSSFCVLRAIKKENVQAFHVLTNQRRGWTWRFSPLWRLANHEREAGHAAEAARQYIRINAQAASNHKGLAPPASFPPKLSFVVKHITGKKWSSSLKFHSKHTVCGAQEQMEPVKSYSYLSCVNLPTKFKIFTCISILFFCKQTAARLLVSLYVWQFDKPTDWMNINWMNITESYVQKKSALISATACATKKLTEFFAVLLQKK